MQSTENWRSIAGYEDLYEVSSAGSVRSLNGRWKNKGVPVLMKATPIPSGYLTVVLHKAGRRQTRSVHRLVAEAFLHERFGCDLVRHIDGSKTNNHVGNLAWGTPSENAQDSVLHGTNHNARKTHCSNGHEFTEENTANYEGNSRTCKQCNRDRGLANYAKAKERNL